MKTNQWNAVAFGAFWGAALLSGVACSSGVASQPSGGTATPVAEISTTPTPQQDTPTPQPTPREEPTPITVIDTVEPEATAEKEGTSELTEADEVDLVRLAMQWA